MFKYMFLLFFPSACMLFAVFNFWLFFIKIPEIWDRIFGEHTVLICGMGKSTIERRRNFDNKIISSHTFPDISSLLIEKECCGYTIPPILEEKSWH